MDDNHRFQTTSDLFKNHFQFHSFPDFNYRSQFLLSDTSATQTIHTKTGSRTILESETLILIDCSLFQNIAAPDKQNGGALYISLPNPATYIRFTQFSKCSSSLQGGTLYFSGSTLQLYGCLSDQCTAPTAAFAFCDSSNSQSLISFTDTLISTPNPAHPAYRDVTCLHNAGYELLHCNFSHCVTEKFGACGYFKSPSYVDFIRSVVYKSSIQLFWMWDIPKSTTMRYQELLLCEVLSNGDSALIETNSDLSFTQLSIYFDDNAQNSKLILKKWDDPTVRFDRCVANSDYSDVNININIEASISTTVPVFKYADEQTIPPKPSPSPSPERSPTQSPIATMSPARTDLPKQTPSESPAPSPGPTPWPTPTATPPATPHPTPTASRSEWPMRTPYPSSTPTSTPKYMIYFGSSVGGAFALSAIIFIIVFLCREARESSSEHTSKFKKMRGSFNGEFSPDGSDGDPTAFGVDSDSGNGF